jgi:hypothetical protein
VTKRRYDVDAITPKKSERLDRNKADKNLITEKGRSPVLSGVSVSNNLINYNYRLVIKILSQYAGLPPRV